MRLDVFSSSNNYIFKWYKIYGLILSKFSIVNLRGSSFLTVCWTEFRNKRCIKKLIYSFKEVSNGAVLGFVAGKRSWYYQFCFFHRTKSCETTRFLFNDDIRFLSSRCIEILTLKKRERIASNACREERSIIAYPLCYYGA